MTSWLPTLSFTGHSKEQICDLWIAFGRMATTCSVCIPAHSASADGSRCSEGAILISCRSRLHVPQGLLVCFPILVSDSRELALRARQWRGVQSGAGRCEGALQRRARLCHMCREPSTICRSREVIVTNCHCDFME